MVTASMISERITVLISSFIPCSTSRNNRSRFRSGFAPNLLSANPQVCAVQNSSVLGTRKVHIGTWSVLSQLSAAKITVSLTAGNLGFTGVTSARYSKLKQRTIVAENLRKAQLRVTRPLAFRFIERFTMFQEKD